MEGGGAEDMEGGHGVTAGPAQGYQELPQATLTVTSAISGAVVFRGISAIERVNGR